MESITTYRQTPETLRAMIERAYGTGLVPAGDDFAHELGHGWFNVAYLLRLADGREVVMKIAPPPGVEVMTYETDALAGEVAVIRLLGSSPTTSPRSRPRRPRCGSSPSRTPSAAFVSLTAAWYQSLGHARPSFVLSVGALLLIKLPVLVVLGLFGVPTIWWAFPVGEALAAFWLWRRPISTAA